MADMEKLGNRLSHFGVWQFTDGVSSGEAVSYTHLTLPTILRV